ncbi:MAG: serine/threonine-protein kinase [Planctomycetota bacterium]
MTSEFCPPDSQLQQFLRGDLNAQEEQQVAEHVNECVRCQQMLSDQPRRDDTWVLSFPPTREKSARLKEKLADLKQSLSDDSGEFEKVFTDLQPWLEPGRALGRVAEFELLECVGRGGMGIVFRAEDTKLNRLVAVKVLSPSLLAESTASARFMREAQAAAGINHDHVVTVYGVSQVRELPYLVMEFVEGESLSKFQAATPKLPFERLVKIASDCCAALSAAHASGIVHRDVKPANILLDAKTDRALLTDFGLARGIEQNSSMTQTGLFLGTPEYVAPEQIEGKAVDHRADLFSLGCVMYRLASGTTPFVGPSIMSTLNAVCHGEATPLENKNSEIPFWFSQLVQQLLHKQPSERPQSADEVQQLLNSGNTSTATVDSNWASRDHWPWALGIGLSIVLICFCLYWIPAGTDKQNAQASEGESRPRKASGSTEASEDNNANGDWTRDGNPLEDEQFPSFTAEGSEQLENLLVEHDRIEIVLTSEEPYRLVGLELENSRVNLVAAEGLSPTLELELGENESGITLLSGELWMEGIILKNAWDEEFEDDEEEETDHDDDHEGSDEDDEYEGSDEDENGEHRLGTLVEVAGGKLYVIRCRLENRDGTSCVAFGGDGAHFESTEIFAAEGECVLWESGTESELSFENCVLVGESCISIASQAFSTLKMKKNTFWANANMVLEAEQDMQDLLQVESSRNLFFAKDSMMLAFESDSLLFLESWAGDHNVLPRSLLVVIDEDDIEAEVISSLQELNDSTVREQDSVQQELEFAKSESEIEDRLADGTLRAIHLNPTEHQDAGAGIFGVGP